MMEFKFEKAAMKGLPLPQKLDIVDSCLYVALKNLYAMYRQGLITRKDATEEKRRLVYNWTGDKSKLELLNRQSAALRGKIGEASEKYFKDPTIENADALYAALYGLADNWREGESL